MMETVIFNVVTTVMPLILAIAVHEYAHIAMARFLGDDLGTRLGRYTLNPLAHIDPIWTVALPVFSVVSQTLSGGFFAIPFLAAGKPAPYNPIRLDRRFNGKRIGMGTGEMLVALAGPVSNLLLALLTTGLMIALVQGGASLDFEAEPRSFVLLAFKFVVLNLTLFLFNLIPVSPLDGSKIIAHFLPTQMANAYRDFMDRFGSILLVVLFVGGARLIIGPVQAVFIEQLWNVVVRFR